MHDSWKPYDHIQTTYWDVTVYPQEPMATPVPNITKYSSAEYREKDETWVGGRVECICVESCSLQVAVKVVRTRLPTRTESVLRPAIRNLHVMVDMPRAFFVFSFQQGRTITLIMNSVQIAIVLEGLFDFRYIVADLQWYGRTSNSPI